MSRLRELFIARILKIVRGARQHESGFSQGKIEGCIVIGDREKISVGESVSFGGNVILFANAPIEIGKHTMIGINSLLHTSTHNYNRHPMWIERIDRPIRIGAHVWVGGNVTIAAGVIINDYAVIGAGSVVVANVPEYAIVAGNPARIIKYRDKKLIDTSNEFQYPIDSVVSKLDYLDKDCREGF